MVGHEYGCSVGEEQLMDALVRHAVRPVLVRLLPLVDHHAALQLQHLLVENGEEEGHPLALQPEGELHRVRGNDLVIVGAVQPGGAVVAPAHPLQHPIELTLGAVLRALEQEMLQEMGEPGAARPLVPGADVIHHVDGDHGGAAVLVEHDAHPVGERGRLGGDPQRR